jgi:hypothetical protein
MAITDINISEQLQTSAPSIRYSGSEGPQSPPQHQQEMKIAQQIWEALGPEQQSQFQSFEEFFRSGVWKQILQQMQADEAQGQAQGIGSLGPQPMEQQMPTPNRMGARLGGDMEELSMRETIDTPQGIETIQDTETMRMADWDDVTPLELESLELLREEFRNDNNGQEPRSIQDLMKFMFNKYGPTGVAKVKRAIAQNKQMAAQGGRP